ncbi:MAG: hypothetical protein AB1744_14455, partial [Candidatus Zixiibacteriota bacterium]
DLNRILVRPLYFGLFVNVLIPVAGLFVCYYINNNYGRENVIGNLANQIFVLFAILALVQAGLAVWWYRRRLAQRLVRSQESFEDDLATGLLARVRPVFVVIATISIYGYLYFFLTGRFTETVLFVLVSFIVFQLLRPRHGSVRRIIARQQDLLESSS